MEIKIGCDPEVFVRQQGTFKSAYGLIQGDKANPQPVRNGAVQVDGMALEFNIVPALTEDQFAYNVQDVFNQLKLMVPDYEIVTVPVAQFDPAYMAAQPMEALELGCDPDFNAWHQGAVNQKPNGDRPMRTASGHIHIGWTDGQNINDGEHQANCNEVAKQMDFFLGLPSLAYDDDKLRRSMYGKAGCVRYKAYGVEYRTLSNAWLRSESLMRWVYRNAQKGMEALINGRNLSQKYGDIQAIINESNRKEAEKIIKAEGIEVCYG
jgi:hypothetical protein